MMNEIMSNEFKSLFTAEELDLIQLELDKAKKEAEEEIAAMKAQEEREARRKAIVTLAKQMAQDYKRELIENYKAGAEQRAEQTTADLLQKANKIINAANEISNNKNGDMKLDLILEKLKESKDESTESESGFESGFDTIETEYVGVSNEEVAVELPDKEEMDRFKEQEKAFKILRNLGYSTDTIGKLLDKGYLEVADDYESMLLTVEDFADENDIFLEVDHEYLERDRKSKKNLIDNFDEFMEDSFVDEIEAAKKEAAFTETLAEGGEIFFLV